MRKATIIDIAKFAGVSVGTVSKVINNKKVKPHIKEKVEYAIQELDYHPNTAARNLRTNKSKAFVFIVTDISNFTFATIAKALNDVLDNYGYDLILYNLGKNDIESRLEQFFSMRNVDGAFLAIGEENNARIKRLLSELEIPLLILDRQIDCSSADFVFSDYYNGVRRATDYLTSIGHKDIALITGSMEIYPGREGVRGYKDALKLNDIDVNLEYIRTGGFSIEFGVQSAEMIVPYIKSKKITAIITGGNSILLGVLKTFKKHEININQDVTVVSFEDSDIAEIMSISVIKRPLYDIGTKMAYTLINRLTKEQEDLPTSSIIIPTELVIRPT